MNIVFISNIVLEPWLDSLMRNKFGQGTSIKFINYAEHKTEKSNILIRDADYLIVCLNWELEHPDIVNCIIKEKEKKEEIFNSTKNFYSCLYRNLKFITKAKIIWFGFEDYYMQYKYVIGNVYTPFNIVDEINFELAKIVTKENVWINLKNIIAETGIQNAYNNTNKYRWDSPYSMLLIEKISEEIYKQHLNSRWISKKCLVLDCDNVLWGGSLIDDGIDRIKLSNIGLGRAYKDFQRFLLFLYNHGIILTVCSKNDADDIYKVFRTHDEMLLKEENIVLFQVNWNNKADNIKMISEKLNIGLDSIIFIDDSYFEVEAVKTFLPEVNSIVFNKDTIYQNLYCLNLNLNINKQDIDCRNKNYKTNHKREKLKLKSKSYIEYLDSLEMTIDIHKSQPIEYERIAELTQRTNKYTNGKRYTTEEIKRNLENSNYSLYSVFVSDKFSDLGLVGAIGIFNQKLELFTLSCRALGRNIESAMLDIIMSQKINDYFFVSTGKNEELHNKLENEL